MDITVTVNDLREIFNQRKRLRFLRFSFTQRTQRKRLRLNGNRALAYNIRPAFKQILSILTKKNDSFRSLHRV